MARAIDTNLTETGNWRAIQPIQDQDVRWVFNEEDIDHTNVTGLLMGNMVAVIGLVVLMIGMICFICKKQNQMEVMKFGSGKDIENPHVQHTDDSADEKHLGNAVELTSPNPTFKQS